MNKLLLPALSILTAFVATIASTDIYLPSMPEMVRYFGVSDDLMRMTIPSYFIGAFIASPLWGTVSDHIGRRPTLLIGLSLFLIATLACTFAPSFYVLLIARSFQGMGSVVAPVVGWAAIQDLYPANKSVKIIAQFGTVMTICPMIAPTVGGLIDVSLGWRWNFGVLAILGAISLVALFKVMVEPNPTQEKQLLSVGATFRNYGSIVTHRIFLCSVMIFAFLSAGEWAFITLGPFYFANVLNQTSDVFGFYITLCGVGYVLGTILTPRIMDRVGLENTIIVGVLIAVVGCGVLGISLLLSLSDALVVCISIGVFFLGASITWGPSTSRALQCFDNIRGSASAVRGIILNIACFLGGLVGSHLDYITLIPLFFFLLLMAMGSTLMFYLGPRQVQKNQHSSLAGSMLR
jgi:DHA1 family bicyclomycin/chloramphenicol resistance-like MFS transporter